MARSVARRRADAAAPPQWIKPQLTQLVDAAPDGPDWLHEIKFDGYRMHARLDRGAVRLLTRTGLDWTHKYPALGIEQAIDTVLPGEPEHALAIEGKGRAVGAASVEFPGP
jgi:ATP-dependent DNA ligase